MRFLFLAGVEGTGHHMVHAIIRPFLGDGRFIVNGDWHRILVHRWDPERRFKMQSRGVLSLLRRRRRTANLPMVFRRYKEAGATHLLETASFPFDHPRCSIRRPDLIDLMGVLSETEQIDEVRFLVLYRDPVSATYSAVRRKFTRNYFAQAKIVEDNFIYMTRQLSVLPASTYRTLDFESFVADPDPWVPALCRWWDLDEELLQRGLTHLTEPTSLAKIPPEQRDRLEGFFTPRRRSQWEEFFRRTRLRCEARC